MPGFKQTYCAICHKQTEHNLYVNSMGYLHSFCTDCGKDVGSSEMINRQTGEAAKHCSRCGTVTEHVRYAGSNDYVHWFCCSCGQDVHSILKDA